MRLLLSDLYTICHFSSGRRILVYEQMQPIAQRMEDTILLEHIARGLVHDWHTRELDMRWKASAERTALYGGGLKGAKHDVDRLLTGIRDVTSVHLHGLGAADPQADVLQQFLADVFPSGVGGITSLVYVDQAASTQLVLNKLQGPYAVLVAELGLGRKVEQLAAASQKLRVGLRDSQGKLDFKQVREARLRGQAILLEIVSVILGRYFDSTNPVQVAAREELLTPVMVQDALVRARRRASRANGGEVEEVEEVVLPEAGDEDEQEDALDEEEDPGTAEIPAEDSGTTAEPAPAGTPATSLRR